MAFTQMISANESSEAAGDESISRVLGKRAVMLGEFQLLEKIGEGAMGAVYLAWQQSFQRHVALKVLFPHIASNPKLVERLYREGRAMGQLDHSGIIQAYAIGEDEGSHYVAMEYVDGVNMQRWMHRLGKIPVADALAIAIRCAEALDHAHRHGMVHRDVKPDNIIISRSGEVKLADLGMVKTHEEDLSLTQTGHAVGTPWYMPMEQAKNAKDADGRSDIYALGCTLYAFLAGRPPFSGKTLVDVIQAKAVGTFPPARQFNPDVPERLDLILAKMIQRQPKYRYQTCEELLADLKSLNLAGETITLGRADEEPTSPSQPALNNDDSDEARTATSPIVYKRQSSVEIENEFWFVRLKDSEGRPYLKQFTASQIREKLQDGTLKPTAKASKTETEGFRTLAAIREFEGRAINKISKKQVDRSASKYRDLYDQYEVKEKQREETEQDYIQSLNPYLQWAKDHWQYLAWAGGALGVLLFFLILGWALR